MVRAILDSNILIDFLRQVEPAVAELRGYDDIAISVVTWIEVMTEVEPDKQADTMRFLRRYSVLPLDDRVSEATVAIRRSTRLKLPDAIILATARVSGRLLVTRDVKAFDPDDPGIRIPYRL